MRNPQRVVFSLVCTLLLAGSVFPQSHPSLFLTPQDVNAMKEAVGKYPLFDASLNSAKERVNQAVASAMDVPVPRDAGGYTHETHKQNYTSMHLAGILFQVTGESKYAGYVKEMLLKYADLYPTLGRHPAAAGEASGRLFWQTLNETVWLVHAAQAYDCIYEILTPAERKRIEENIFRLMAKFFVEEQTHELDRIHNHGTWTCAAVGMAGYILGDKELTKMALYGSKKDGSGGYLKQLEMLFSPDGFYTEGPYYARYALWPFFTFAQVLHHNEKELGVYDFRNRILERALYSALQLTYTNGAFIPFNDALKEKSFLSPELITAVDIVYARYSHDRSLLSIVKKHSEVMLSGDGVEVAKALYQNPDVGEFSYKSVEYTDGPNGTEGGFGILRSGPFEDQSLVFMKYTGHGLSHGHFDKLSIGYYDQGREVLQDYGSARFINVELKYGGRYLPENKSFGMQTIAHNTVTVDQKSHFDGKMSVSEKYHADRHFFSSADPNYQIMSAKADSVYEGVRMQRTVALVSDSAFSKPVILDVFRIDADHEHTYDLPFYYMGHLTNTSVRYRAFDKQRTVLGASNGYQHLWSEAEGTAPGPVQVSWMLGNRFYTVTSSADSSTAVYFVRIGAGDPNFNLRSEPGFILRKKGRAQVFASVIEPHGAWDGTREFSSGARPEVTGVRVLSSDKNLTAIEVEGTKTHWLFFVANGEPNDQREYSYVHRGVRHTWRGNSHLARLTR